MATKTKPDFASLTSTEDDQENSPGIQSVELLTNEAKRDPLDHPSGRKNPMDEYVMVGIRMTRRQRKATKQLAADLEITIQELVRQAIVMYRDSKGHR
jgi:hypothetical protein